MHDISSQSLAGCWHYSFRQACPMTHAPVILRAMCRRLRCTLLMWTQQQLCWRMTTVRCHGWWQQALAVSGRLPLPMQWLHNHRTQLIAAKAWTRKTAHGDEHRILLCLLSCAPIVLICGMVCSETQKHPLHPVKLSTTIALQIFLAPRNVTRWPGPVPCGGSWLSASLEHTTVSLSNLLLMAAHVVVTNAQQCVAYWTDQALQVQVSEAQWQ